MSKLRTAWIAFGLIAFGIWGSSDWIPSAHAIFVSNPFSSVDPYGLSPFWKWKTLETENFRVTFPQELQPIATDAAVHLENAHRLLKPELHWQPRIKTQVLVIDNSDAANGLASAFAHFGLILWITPPEVWYSTAFYDDYLRLLTVHEYTHYLNMDATAGVWEPLRKVFGDVLLPNILWTPWMLEGLAVYMETRFTRGGRGRSTYYEMLLRAAVEAGTLNSPEFITLDRVGGSNPYFPFGETRYQFGYSLMNQLAQSTAGTHQKVFGLLSEQSSYRIPFFINDTLESVSGKTWYKLWDTWVQETQARINRDLKILRSQPTTPVHLLTHSSPDKGQVLLGSAPSPDGEWIAYTLETSDRRQGLYLKNLKTEKTTHLLDKLSGMSLKFTPDSKAIVYSRLHREDPYYLFSDLETYCLENGKASWLTQELRARDPDVSANGSWITFTRGQPGLTGLARAPLLKKEGSCQYELGPVETLIQPERYDRIGTPRFSVKGDKIFFSLHPHGKSQEDLMELDLETRKTRILFSNGYYNRFPAVHPSGDLYFVSNLTGVDNLYRLNSKIEKAEMVTHLTTGLSGPIFSTVDSSKDPQLFGAVFSPSGWNLAQIEYSKTPISNGSLTLAAPPAPPLPAADSQTDSVKVSESRDYTPFSTLAPRFWSPLFGFDGKNADVGAQTWGFDLLNQHRYTAAASYGTQLQLPEVFLLYSNRAFGPALNLAGRLYTATLTESDTNLSFTREVLFSGSLVFPWLWTYSRMSSSFSLLAQKRDDFSRTRNSLSDSWNSGGATETRPFVPSVSWVLGYSNLETSDLAVADEAGRLTQLGARVYQTPDQQQVWKVLLIDQENFRIFPHAILSPSVKASWSSQVNPSFPASGVVLQGRIPQRWINSFNGDSLSQLSIRGYPGQSFSARSALVTALDFNFPLFRVFRGWGTNPVFLENLYAFAFAENTFVPTSSGSVSLPSAGGGLRLSTEFFFLPLTFSGEFQKGFAGNQGGTSDLFFQVLGNVPL